MRAGAERSEVTTRPAVFRPMASWGLGLTARGRRPLTFDNPGTPSQSAQHFVQSEFVACAVGQISDYKVPDFVRTGIARMANRSDTRTDLVAIARLNGEFKQNYGTLLGAFLYLRSLRAASGRSYIWSGLIVAVITGLLSWFGQHGWGWPL